MSWEARNSPPMASSATLLKFWCFITILLCVVATRCKSDEGPVNIVDRALQCFDDHSVYSGCEDSYRLSAEGNLNVPAGYADEYCNGPCLDETKLVLSCISDILYNFKFYNGASLRDVTYTLDSGCGHSSKRGDFNVLEREGYGGEYGDANKPAIPTFLVVLFSCVLLLLIH